MRIWEPWVESVSVNCVYLYEEGGLPGGVKTRDSWMKPPLEVIHSPKAWRFLSDENILGGIFLN